MNISQYTSVLLQGYRAIFESNLDNIYNKYYYNMSRSAFDNINKYDPTSNDGNKKGSYLPWLLKLYNADNLKLEDLYKAKEYLTIFNKYKSKLEITDINKIKDLRQLYKIIQPVIKSLDQGSDEYKSISEKNKDIKSNVKKYYSDDHWEIIIPLTKEASCVYGKGTQWCTAADVSENAFDEYNKKGPLFIMIYKPTGEKFQYHGETHSFMDSNDNPVYDLVSEIIELDDDEASESPIINIINSIPDKFIDLLVNDGYDISTFSSMSTLAPDIIKKFGNEWLKSDPVDILKKNNMMYFSLLDNGVDIDSVLHKLDDDTRRKLLTKLVNDPRLTISYRSLNLEPETYANNTYLYDEYIKKVKEYVHADSSIKKDRAGDMLYRLVSNFRGDISLYHLDNSDLNKYLPVVKELLLYLYHNYSNIRLAYAVSDFYDNFDNERSVDDVVSEINSSDANILWEGGRLPIVPSKYMDSDKVWEAIVYKNIPVPYDKLTPSNKVKYIMTLAKGKPSAELLSNMYKKYPRLPADLFNRIILLHKNDINYVSSLILGSAEGLKYATKYKDVLERFFNQSNPVAINIKFIIPEMINIINSFDDKNTKDNFIKYIVSLIDKPRVDILLKQLSI